MRKFLIMKIFESKNLSGFKSIKFLHLLIRKKVKK